MTRQRVLFAVGAAYIAAFLLPWQAGGGFASSGYAELVALEWSRARLLVLSIPIFGVALLVTSLKAPRAAVAVGVVAGLAVLGHFAWLIFGPRGEASLPASQLFSLAGPGFWLLIVASVVALASPLIPRHA